MKTILNPLAILLTACLLVGGCHRSPPPPDSQSGGVPGGAVGGSCEQPGSATTAARVRSTRAARSGWRVRFVIDPPIDRPCLRNNDG